jgi:hypothetical protein
MGSPGNSQADTPQRTMSAKQDNAKPTEPCRYCGSPTREVRNQFFGTGMSVHKWLIVCDSCSVANYLSNPGEDEQPPADATEQSFWSRILKRIRR